MNKAWDCEKMRHTEREREREREREIQPSKHSNPRSTVLERQ